MFARIDLALEIVSLGTDARTHGRTNARTLDYDDKRRDYARAGITEYWIVDPQEDRVTVLVLQDNNYVEHGVFQLDEEATSVLLSGLRVDVRAMFNA